MLTTTTKKRVRDKRRRSRGVTAAEGEVTIQTHGNTIEAEHNVP